MAELKPVPGQVLLTVAEFINLQGTIKRQLSGPDDKAGERFVRSIFQELHQTRLGAPAGEVRRSKHGSLAVRQQDTDGGLGWDITRLEDEDNIPGGTTAEAIRGWTVIHDESWRDRLTEADYKTGGD